MLLGECEVFVWAFGDGLPLHFRQWTHNLRGYSRSESARRDPDARGNDRARSHQCTFPDVGATEDDCANADQRTVTHSGAVHHRSVAKGHTVAKHGWLSRVGMQAALILNVASLADLNPFAVGTQHASVPNA